jgi:hypothetical protein
VFTHVRIGSQFEMDRAHWESLSETTELPGGFFGHFTIENWMSNRGCDRFWKAGHAQPRPGFQTDLRPQKARFDYYH